MKIFPVFAAGAPYNTAVTATSAQFGATLAAGEVWAVLSTTAAYIKMGSDPVVASAASGSWPIGAGQLILLDASMGPKVAIIQQAAGGQASLVKVKAV